MYVWLIVAVYRIRITYHHCPQHTVSESKLCSDEKASCNSGIYLSCTCWKQKSNCVRSTRLHLPVQVLEYLSWITTGSSTVVPVFQQHGHVQTIPTLPVVQVLTQEIQSAKNFEHKRSTRN
jgi:hypothetical protein